jgi:hypothetical protein
MPRGGRRPGAGAPLHNLNHLKNGQCSMQMVQALLASDPRIWTLFLKRVKGAKYRARLNLAATMLWIRLGYSRDDDDPE